MYFSKLLHVFLKLCCYMYLPKLSHFLYFSNSMYVSLVAPARKRRPLNNHPKVVLWHGEQGKVFTCISQNCYSHFSISFVKCVYPKLYLWSHLHVNAAHLTIIQKWSLGTENKVNQRGGENYTTSGSQPLHFLQTTLNGFLRNRFFNSRYYVLYENAIVILSYI